MGNYNFVTEVAKQVKSFFNCKVKKEPKKQLTVNEAQAIKRTSKDCSSEQEHKVNALALGDEEGRD